MVGNSTDPKQYRITVRISDSDRERLMREAERRGVDVGKVIRALIREHLSGRAEVSRP
jgi:predicted DNA binding CopG/RHH family protein